MPTPNSRAKTVQILHLTEGHVYIAFNNGFSNIHHISPSFMPLGGVVVDIDEVPQSTQVIPSADSLRSTLCISGRNHGRKMRQAFHVGKI